MEDLTPLTDNTPTFSKTENVTVHIRDGKRVAVAFFNGHVDMYKLEEPMTRTEYDDFHGTTLV